VPLYLVRHGSAGHRDDSDPDDLQRPLDAKGLAQADDLASLLSSATLGDRPGANLPIEAVVSSPATRCVATVAPLARSLGMTVDVDEALVEGADIDMAWALVERTAKLPAAVLCSHGDVIPMVLRRAQQRGMLIPGKAGCAKGSVWAVTFEDGMPVLGEYFPLR
jgi:8-oxo-dGTP diphosphatase